MRYKVNIPEGCSGDFRVEKKILDEFRNCKEPLDEYTILHCATHHIMSDTTKEYREHQEFFNKAHGDVLVAGLGLGMIHQQLIENDDITSVTIVEKNQEVIDLVWEHCLKNEKFRLVHADIYEWQPDSTWDVGWFDSWIGECEQNFYFDFIEQKYGDFCKEIIFWKEEGSPI